MKKIQSTRPLSNDIKQQIFTVEFGNCSEKLVQAFFMALAMLFFTGCTTVYKGTGNVMIHYAEDEVVPYLLANDDFPMACAMAESLGPFMFSFERVTESPESLKVLLNMMNGQCALAQAEQQQLRYLRHVKRRESASATDARILQKRYLGLAAQRYYHGYLAVSRAYGEPGGQCPKLKTYDDELYWLIGLLNGLQAVFADMKSEYTVQVPLDIALKTSRAAQCLDDHRWWGLPSSIQGAVWAIVPGTAPNDVDPIDVLEKATELGENRRVRLAHILEAEVYLSKGRLEEVKSIIRRHAQQLSEKPADPAMKLFDHVAYLRLLSISDRLWTEATGHRTPWKQYGQFWDDPEEQEGLDINDLL